MMGHENPGVRPNANSVNGVMVATVTNNSDPEKRNRVKLKFAVRENDNETDWVPIASLMGGGGRGTMFVPEVGDEVLVAFEMGSLKLPYVIGSLWTKNSLPPAKHDKNDIRKIRSRGGHELLFQDTDGDGKITIKTSKGFKLDISEKENKVEVATNDSNQSVVLTGGATGTVVVKSAGAKITLDKSGKITIEAPNAVEIKGTQLKIEASAQLTLKASASIDMKSDGIINIKGSLVKIN